MLVLSINQCFLWPITRISHITGNRRFSFHYKCYLTIPEAMREMTEKGSILVMQCIQCKIKKRIYREKESNIQKVYSPKSAKDQWMNRYSIIYHFAIPYLKIYSIKRDLTWYPLILDNYRYWYHLSFFLIPCSCNFQVIIVFQYLRIRASCHLSWMSIMISPAHGVMLGFFVAVKWS